LYELQKGVRARWASPENPSGGKGAGARVDGTRKAHPSVVIPAGQSITLAEVKGESGTIRRMWMTIEDRSPETLRGLRIDIYWDGHDKPAVRAPLGDFFGQPLGRMTAFDSDLLSSPEGRSFNSNIPMPFQKGMKVVVTNETAKPINNCYYTVEYTLGDEHAANIGYFHAYWHRENPTTIRKDFEILPKVKGQGRYLGAVVSVIADQKAYGTTWWGEGEVKMYIDGDGQYPTLAGTGTEDYVGTGWGEGRYANRYQGCTVADDKNLQYGFYRFHTHDWVQFNQDLRVTMQQIGAGADPAQIRTTAQAAGRAVYKSGPRSEPGLDELRDHDYFERQDDWAAVAFFYLDQPTDDLPPLAPAAERVAGLLH